MANLTILQPAKEKLDRLITAVEEIPFHDLPEPGLAYPLIALREHAREFRVRTEWLSDVKALPTAAAPVQTEQLSKIADAFHRDLMKAYRATHANVWSVWDRISNWWTLRPHRAAARRITRELQSGRKEP